jgi:cytochrome c-type biogenesis protein CcsB
MSTNLEISLANFSFLTLFISMIFYWIQTSTFSCITVNLPNAVTSNNSNFSKELISNSNKKHNPFIILVDHSLFPEKNELTINQPLIWLISRYNYLVGGNFSNIGTILMLISNVSIFIVLVLRWQESGHFPLSNLYESLMFLSWSLTFIHLFIELGTLNFKEQSSYSLKISAKNSSLKIGSGANNPVASQGGKNHGKQFFIAKLIGSITSPCALFTNAFASFSLPREMQESSPLVPALQSNWLMMHVTVMILSYAALILGSLLSIGFLVINIQNGKDENLVQKEIYNQSNSSFSNITSIKMPLLCIEKENLSKGHNYGSLSIALDNLSYRILGVGFPLLTIGILSGAVWANEAWGSYWSWDPKETWALLTWLVFAIYLHTRLTKGWEGKKPAWIASVGFITVWVCYLGVNLIGEGLHSYGWLS